MGKKNVLMLGPGEPGSLTSGLGKAADEISQYLADYTYLTIVQPDNLDSLDAIENNISLSKQKISIDDFSDFNVISEISKINVASSISPYWSDQNASRLETKETKSNPLFDQLQDVSKDIVKVIERINHDVIYAHDWITFRAAIDIKAKYNKPLVLHVHSLDYDRNCGKSKSWVFDLEKEAFQEANIIICVSEYSKGIIEKEYGVDPSKIQVIHNGYHQKPKIKTKSPFKEKVVLFVGRLTGQKGPTKFLEIAERVNELYPNSRFIMAGEGDLYKSLIEAGAHSEIANKFHITGYLDEPDLTKLYGMSDVYCMPSVSEPFGLTALEAAGAGLPLVISENSGAAEVMTCALLSKFDDSETFAKHIVSILKDDKKAEKLAKTNSALLPNLSWENSNVKILSIIDSF